jgi:hypothetical protein
MTTDTPRTDAEEVQGFLYADFARQLERELNASKAKVNRLQKQLAEAHEELCQAGLREYGN